jgi:2-hydroxy-4-carboxymuconate semialdehyde hemiacetal dehydrogenase
MAARNKIIETDDATDPHIETSDVEDASTATYLQCDRAAWIGGPVGVNEDNRAGLHIAMVGYGQTASIHSRLLAGEGHHLDWLIGRLPERTRAFAEANIYRRYSTLLDDALTDPGVDAVVLCTPSPMHAEQTAACLEAGKHVLVEIPLAMSYGDGLKLAELARSQNLTLMVAHGHRYQAAMRQARDRVISGRLTLHSVTARYLLLRRDNVGSSGYVRSWTDNLLWHHGQHAIDLVLWLLGVERPGQVEVVSLAATRDPGLGIPLDISVSLRTRRDQIATIALSYNSHVRVYDYVLAGEEDTLVIDNGTLRDSMQVLHRPTGERPDPSWLIQERDFAAAVRERRPAAVSADSVLPALEVLQLAEDAYLAPT